MRGECAAGGGRAGTWGLARGVDGLRAREAARRPLLSLVVQEAAVSTPSVPSLSTWRRGRCPLLLAAVSGAILHPQVSLHSGPEWFRAPRKCVLLSLLAFICEEVVSQCTLCGGLYFFEFVSCSAFLLSLLLLIVYCTPVYDRVDNTKVKSSDFYITLGTGCVFLLASIIFVSTHDRTSAEIAAIAFGFLASFMFLFDFGAMLFEKLQESQLRKPENTTRAEALTEPLNA
ncbi:CKLF-like MARVEL transmembrane domain-containing protein 6 [Marmota marmota marmota]|uniref:CKLF-like MARVEL transmembrane domain-containing protein 6 n=1 Tax=Marmota marmota marmota TaxID=9994 RepID=UPI0007625B03|nr:CKLF-like MARVEL transmembrane domain-containing protein 6 [Marmota marmota marmota]